MIDKHVVSSVDKSFNATQTNGQIVKLSTHIAVDPTSPLEVSVQRDPTTQDWVSKTISTGVVVTTQVGQNSHVDSTYTDLVFTPAAGCVPVGGTISGGIYTGDNTDPINTFQITFYAGAGQIVYGDGTTADYVPDYCALDDTN